MIITDDGAYNAFPSIARLYDGKLLLTYRKGPSHLGKGVIAAKKSNDDGATWSEEEVIITDLVYDLRCGEVRQLSSGPLLLATTAYNHLGPNPILGGARIYRSLDCGDTWQGPIIIPSLLTGWTFTQSPPCEMPDGDVLLPIYGIRTGEAMTSVTIVQSSDNGETWGQERLLHNALAHKFGCNECVIAETYAGYTALMRGQSQSIIFSSHSVDGGRRWSVPTQAFAGSGKPSFTELPNGTLRVVYRDGVTNKTYQRESYDAGRTWSSGYLFTNGYYMYADSVIRQDGSHFMVYSIETSPSQAFISSFEFDLPI